MNNPCSATADSITSILLAGDAVLNLSGEPLNTVSGTLYIAANNGETRLQAEPAQVNWTTDLAASIPGLVTDGVQRLVVVANDATDDVPMAVVRELEAQNVPCVLCTLSVDCDADAFMDEEDAEAVAERLRQLGYI
ncbi:MAG: hypothetical protein KDA85_01235 [Planctomycetaceae bacterium]|nr:hypothetical protein [Planctomycetaceae bacterium]